MPLEIGTILHHRYRIEEILGKGGMGAVYRAVDVNLGVHVAVKENYFITEEFARQFRREATILASLRHSNLPRVTDHFVLEGQGQFLVMDYIEGDDLRQMVEENGPLSEQQVLSWFLDICSALTYLHTLTPSIIHRDIKPGNIKVSPDGRAYLVDFGLAKIIDENAGTTMGAKAMTPGYSPPEQYGSGHTDQRTDIYSLAATMYAIMTGVVPEESLERAMGRLALTPINKRNPSISQGMARAIEKAMQVRPVDRYQTVSEFAAAISSIQGAGQATVISNLPFVGRSKTASVDRAQEAPSERKQSRTISKPILPKPVTTENGTRLRRRLPMYLIGFFTLILVVYGASYALAGSNPRLEAFFAPPTDTTTPGMRTQEIAIGSTESTDAEQNSDGEGQLTTAAPDAIEATESTDEVVTPEAAITDVPQVSLTGGGSGQIAFASDREGVPQIFVMDSDGSNVVRLTSQVDGACQPAWSPDGSQMLFTSPCGRSKATYPGAGIWLINADGTGVTPLPAVAGGGDFDPRWSPDGTQILFTSMRDNRPQVYLMNRDGTGVQNISSNLTTENQPVWKPESSILIFNSWRAGYSELFLVELPDLNEVRYTLTDERDSSRADFSSDGVMLLFQRQVGGIPRLFVKQFDASDRIARQVCSESPLAAYPMTEARWSPDGNWIAFETWPQGDNHQIGLMSSTCGQFQILTADSEAYDFDPDWRP